MRHNNIDKTRVSLRKKIVIVICGIFFSIILLETGIRLGGLVLLSIQEYRNSRAIKQKDVYRIMCLGESTTARQYPKFLEEILNKRNIGIRFSVIDKGIIGTNTFVILSQLKQNLDIYKPNMVVIMAGMNDTGISYYKDIPEVNTAAFQYCKVYRFMRVMYMHIVKKLRKQDIHGLTKINPENDNSYLESGRLYRVQGKYPQAEALFRKAIELNPGNDNAYIELGLVYVDQDKYPQAEALFRKAIELNPGNDNAYSELGRLYRIQGNYPQAEALFRKAIELNPRNNNAYTGLGWLYRIQGNYPQAEDLFKKIIDLYPENDCAYGAISVLYEETGKPELAKEYANNARRLRLEYYKPVTVNNFLKLKEILDERGVRLVCAQYPMRDLWPLKKIFENDEKGVIFVDNGGTFKETVKKEGFKEVFRDMFGGDFGHCTQKGNKLLAGNIADVILKEVFGK